MSKGGSAEHVENSSGQWIGHGEVLTTAEKHEPSIDRGGSVAIDDEYRTLAFPPPWPYEKFFPGGFSQRRMLKFKKAKTMYQAINIFAGVAIMFYGYDQGVMSMVNLNADYLRLMNIDSTSSDFKPVLAKGGIVAVYYVGTVFGALLAGSLADRMGRLRAVVFGCVWAIIGAALQAAAFNIEWMCIARVISGVGVGAIDCVIPVWSSEVSSHQARGAFLAVEFFMNIAGLALAYWIEYAMFNTTPEPVAWRTPLALQLVFLLIIIIGIFFFPESPRWLMKMGREEEARAVLHATRDGDIETEVRNIKRVVKWELETSSMNHYWAMLFPKDHHSRQLRWRMILVIWLQIMQELTGIGVITVYAVDLIKTAGYDDNTAKILAGSNNVSYMFSVILAVYTLDRFGRRAALVWGALVMAGFLLIGGVLDKFAAEPSEQQKALGAAVAAMVFGYTATFGATWLTVPWLYPTEIFPLNVRAKGGAFSVVGWAIGNGVVTMITPFLVKAIGYGTMLLFCGLNLALIPFVILFYPETAGRTLENMDTYFDNAGAKNVFRASKNIHSKGIADWHWAKKAPAAMDQALEVEAGGAGKGAAGRSGSVSMDVEIEKDAMKSWTRRPLYTMKRMGSNAGFM